MNERMMAFIRWLLRMVWGMLVGWLVEFIQLLVSWHRQLWAYCRARKDGPRKPPMRCIPIPGDVYQRPDPYLYSQKYLRSLGLAVTWDNPDIWLERNGVAVDSNELVPNTLYSVVIRVWNASYEAPAPGLSVSLDRRSFGVNGGRTPIGQTVVDLPVRGAPNHPTFARIPWTTPDVGHYCLEAVLEWPDDANTLNNVGQENTDVRRLSSGEQALFRVPVTNDRVEPAQFRMRLSGYRLPEAPLEWEGTARKTTPLPRTRAFNRPGREVNDRVDRVIALNRWDAFPPDPLWAPEISREAIQLDPGETGEVVVRMQSPANASAGDRYIVTLVAEDERDVAVGGVTLIGEVS